MQDITPVDDIRTNPKCDREIAVYGYLRGTKLKGNARVHIAGVGDATVSGIDTMVFCCVFAICFRHSGSCTHRVANCSQHGLYDAWRNACPL